MLLVFTDGLDEDVEDLEETVEDLRKKGKILYASEKKFTC